MISVFAMDYCFGIANPEERERYKIRDGTVSEFVETSGLQIPKNGTLGTYSQSLLALFFYSVKIIWFCFKRNIPVIQ